MCQQDVLQARPIHASRTPRLSLNQPAHPFLRGDGTTLMRPKDAFRLPCRELGRLRTLQTHGRGAPAVSVLDQAFTRRHG